MAVLRWLASAIAGAIRGDHWFTVRAGRDGLRVGVSRPVYRLCNFGCGWRGSVDDREFTGFAMDELDQHMAAVHGYPEIQAPIRAAQRVLGRVA